MPRLLIHFSRYGPYHHARLGSAVAAMEPLGWEVIGLETAGTDSTYAWNTVGGTTGGRRIVTVFPERIFEKIADAEMRSGVSDLLDKLHPDAIAIAGWGGVDARACLGWCRRAGAKAIVMSETREADGHRAWWKEWLKSRIIRKFDAALVGGKSHRDYLVKLGIPEHRVTYGYNVVDNAYFAGEKEKWLSATHLPTANCQLPTVYFPGFRQIDELPKFYAHAGCFVHPALEEPWGLVINEAMACGLPVLSGTNVGAAEELVEDGVNGWTFDATSVDAMCEAMSRLASLSAEELHRMGEAAKRVLDAKASTKAFGEGLRRLLVG